MDDEYDGHWMDTYTGKHFHLLNPQSDEVDIQDIAHHLSLLCRFTGACRTFYSVAEHSVRVSHIVSPKSQLAALLHDAAETYINDVSRPVKNIIAQIEALDLSLLEFIYQTLQITGFDWNEIKHADDVLVMTEGRDLMVNSYMWRKVAEPLPEKIVPMLPREAESLFLARYKYLEVARQ